MAPPLIEVANI